MASIDCLSKRSLLYILVFSGFAINYTVRVNMNIAVVSMVKRKNHSWDREGENGLNLSLIENLNLTTYKQHPDNRRYEWDESQQAQILGSFFWLHWVTQIPGGILSNKYGTKLIFGLSNFIGCLLSLFVPFCADFGYQTIVTIRVVQGLLSGLAWPSMHAMVARWIPANERSTFISSYSAGGSVGAALTFFSCGFLIKWLDWPSVFYATASVGVLWSVCWWVVVYDSPAQHPYISERERLYIENDLGKHVGNRKMKVPWKDIIMSPAVWIIILAQWGALWGLFTLLTQTPTYFKNIHGIKIHMTGVLSSLPHICRLVFAIVISFTGDHLLKQGILSRIFLRKTATLICTFMQGIFLIGLSFSEDNYLVAAVCVSLAVGCSAGLSTGPVANQVDISPNFASVLLGIANMVTVVTGFVSPILVGYLTYGNQTSVQWKKFFIISAFITSFPGILYMFFGTAEVQIWNAPASIPEEMKELEADNDKIKNEQT